MGGGESILSWVMHQEKGASQNRGHNRREYKLTETGVSKNRRGRKQKANHIQSVTEANIDSPLEA